MPADRSSYLDGRRALRFLPVAATEQQRKEARMSALYQQGDMRLVWVNAGDLAHLQCTGRALSYGKAEDTDA